MKKMSVAALQTEYDRLRKTLIEIGYISQGSVLDRSKLKTPRSGYQWTRKIARKTITVALSPEQFESLKVAIQNRKKLSRAITHMEKISRQILFKTLPDTKRHKPLTSKVLGVN
jgi:hypothetical protein